jgi:hypothetical protein
LSLRSTIYLAVSASLAWISFLRKHYRYLAKLTKNLINNPSDAFQDAPFALATRMGAQPTRTASIETEPPSTPSTGNVSGSESVRVPTT